MIIHRIDILDEIQSTSFNAKFCFEFRVSLSLVLVFLKILQVNLQYKRKEKIEVYTMDISLLAYFIYLKFYFKFILFRFPLMERSLCPFSLLLQ